MKSLTPYKIKDYKDIFPEKTIKQDIESKIDKINKAIKTLKLGEFIKLEEEDWKFSLRTTPNTAFNTIYRHNLRSGINIHIRDKIIYISKS